MPKERVTITLPAEIVRDIDSQEDNRSRFILQAVTRELEHQRRKTLRHSIENPHPESRDTAELGLEDWRGHLPEGDEVLLDPEAGTDVRWTPGQGWVEVSG